jgi:hypothetical protein
VRTTLYLVVVHLTGLALAVLSVIRSGDRPQVLIYAFVLEYAVRLAMIFVATRTLAAGRPVVIAQLAAAVCRLPAPGQHAYPLTYEGSNQPAGAGAYAFVMAFLIFLAVVLSNVNPDRELDLDARVLSRDLRWAVLVAAIYWLESLLTRTTVIDPRASSATNFGYNTRDVIILAFATLSAGAVVVIRQGMRLPASGWVVLGPLFVFRFLYDLFAALQQPET